MSLTLLWPHKAILTEEFYRIHGGDSDMDIVLRLKYPCVPQPH